MAGPISWGMVGVGLLSAAALAAVPHSIETIEISAGQHQPAYRLEVQGVEPANQMDDSRHLAVFGAGRSTIVTVEGGLATTRDSIPPALLASNTLHSRFVFRSPLMPSNMVIVFGHAFDTGPVEMRIIRLNATSAAEQVLSEEEFHITAVRRGADGHSLLVIGKRSLSEMGSKCVSTYDPYAVLILRDEEKGRFQYSLALSKKYNLAHYAGWAGPKAREDIGVNICGKPARIVRL